MYHNKRDASGRFAKKATSTTKKRPATKKVEQRERIVSFYLLDDTGSMESKKGATIQGFNKVLNDSRAADLMNKVDSTEILALFGQTHEFEVRKDIQELTHQTYNPGASWTALWSAIIKSIQHLEGIVKPEDKVVLTIFTDGYNNQADSLESKAKELITKYNKEGWVINFVGAGDKAFVEKVATSVNINISNTLSFTNDSAGVQAATAKLSSSRGFYSKSVSEKKSKNIGFFANKN